MANYTALHAFPIVAGTDYGQAGSSLSAWAVGTTYAQGARVTFVSAGQPRAQIFQSVAAGNVGHTPGTGTAWLSLGLQATMIYGVLCTASNTGTTVIQFNGDSSQVSFPAGSFVKGVVYYFSLSKLVTAEGVSFVGLTSMS